MTKNVSLTVILPAYREEENLNLLLPRLNEVLLKLESTGVSYEIIVVDTIEALDQTAIVCQKNKVIYLNRQYSNSFGSAVRTGIQHSKGERVIFMDSDGSHPPEFMNHLLAYKNTYDIVIASRYVPGGDTENPWLLIFMSRVLNIIYAKTLGIPCRDVSNSFKLYRGDWLRTLQLKCENFDIVEEIMVKIMKKYPAVRIKEVPFIFKKRIFGETKRNLFKFILTYFVTLLRLKMMK